MEHYVIIGNGAAGNRATRELRERETDIRITIISAEPTHNLYRHRMAAFLAGKYNLEEILVHPPEWYEQRNIQLRLNQPVVQVDPRNKTILLAHRERISYDKLLICSGGRHRIPEYLSHFENRVSKFSTSTDMLKLKARLDKIERLTMLGGDCIALQLVQCLLPAGKKITMIMDEYRFWPLEFDEAVKERMTSSLEKKGVEVIRDDFVVDISRRNGGLAVETRGGAKIETDEAIVCSGMVPCLEFLSDSGIDIQQGILVNERLETNVENVWAAGECAQIYYDEIKTYRCSTGYVNAMMQGEAAAANMLGGSEHVPLCEPGKVIIAGETFTTYGWKGFSLDETD